MRAKYAVTSEKVYMEVWDGDELLGFEDYFFEDMEFEDVFYLPCGCAVEPDGRCYHGVKSPMLVAGII